MQILQNAGGDQTKNQIFFTATLLFPSQKVTNLGKNEIWAKFCPCNFYDEVMPGLFSNSSLLWIACMDE